MKSFVDNRFWRAYNKLPADVQKQADAAYLIWLKNPFHPSLRFKRVDDQDPIFSARIGRSHRALGWRDGDTIIWFWIGGHDEYDRILG